MKRIFWLLVVNEYLSESFFLIFFHCIGLYPWRSTRVSFYDAQCGMMDANGELEKSSDTIILQQEKELQWQPKFENDYFSKA